MKLFVPTANGRSLHKITIPLTLDFYSVTYHDFPLFPEKSGESINFPRPLAVMVLGLRINYRLACVELIYGYAQVG
jgi:hypothetical protein